VAVPPPPPASILGEGAADFVRAFVDCEFPESFASLLGVFRWGVPLRCKL